MTKQLLQRALDALEGLFGGAGGVAVWRLGGSHAPQQAIAELRAAIAAPEVEPVAWTVTEMDSVITNSDKQTNAIQFSQRYLDMHDIPLYTTPPDTEALRRDAERYRWLAGQARQKTAYDVYGTGGHWSIGIHSDDQHKSVSEVIDAAIAAQGGEG